jgi:hypothetical protein
MSSVTRQKKCRLVSNTLPSSPFQFLNIGNQGCQVFLGTTYQHVKNIPNDHKIYTKWPQNVYQMTTKFIPNDHKMYTKWPQNIYQITTKCIPNDHKMYTKWPLNIPNGCKIFQMAIKCTNILHSKALHNIPRMWIFGMKLYNLATQHETAFIPAYFFIEAF